MREEERLLTDIIKCHTESATTTKLLLKNIGEVMSAMSTHLVNIEAFMQELKSSRESFYKYSVKIFIVIFFAQLLIIGMLLQRLNVKGADVIKDVGTTGVKNAGSNFSGSK